MWYDRKIVNEPDPAIFAFKGSETLVLLPQTNNDDTHDVVGYDWFDLGQGDYSSCVHFGTPEDAMYPYKSWDICKGTLTYQQYRPAKGKRWYSQGEVDIDMTMPIVAKNEHLELFLLPRINKDSYKIIGYNWFNLNYGWYQTPHTFQTAFEALSCYRSFNQFNAILGSSFTDKGER